MTDVTQGADAPDDAALFREATTDTTTLDAFENPKPEPEKPAEPDKPAEPKPAEPKQQDEPPVPAGRLREESEARRRAERERDELAQRFAAMQRPQQPQQPAKQPDVFEDPQGFVKSIVEPLMAQQKQEMQLQREAYSMDMAAQRFGPELVTHSRQALEHFMSRGDPMAWATYNRAMQSHDPYGVIAGWYHERSLLHEVGNDPNAYVERKFEERMEKDPEFRKKVFEKFKTQAASSGNAAFTPPVTSSVPKMPSLGNIGAGGGDAQITEPSDMELFRAATSAKRR
jgi:hypothetical protein